MGFWGDFFNGKKVEAENVPDRTPWAREVMLDWAFSPFKFNEEAGAWEMAGSDKYPDQLNVDIASTMMPDVWGSYNSKGNKGTDYMDQMLTKGFSMSDLMKSTQANMLQYGGPAGPVTQNMGNMAQWGGAGQKGHPAMDMMMQYGSPSQHVGQYLQNMAQFGIPSEAGRIVANRAQGMPVGGASWLAGYGQPAPWNTPMMGGR